MAPLVELAALTAIEMMFEIWVIVAIMLEPDTD